MKSLRCPKCDVPLKSGERAGVAFEWCSQCHGAWLDLFQLDLILHRAQPPEEAEARPDDGSDTEVPAVAEVRRKE